MQASSTDRQSPTINWSIRPLIVRTVPPYVPNTYVMTAFHAENQVHPVEISRHRLMGCAAAIVFGRTFLPFSVPPLSSLLSVYLTTSVPCSVANGL
jgi:hypothetical protein